MRRQQYWLPATDDRARITDLRTGAVVEGIALAVLHYPRGGWSVTLMTETGETVGVTDQDVRADRMPPPGRSFFKRRANA